MEESILRDYLYAYNQYKNVNKEDKIRKDEFLQIEKDSLEKNRTKINERKGSQIVTMIFGAITILSALNKTNGTSWYEIIMIILSILGLIYIRRDNKLIENEKEAFEKEKNRMNEINVESLAIKSLLIEQYQHTIR